MCYVFSDQLSLVRRIRQGTLQLKFKFNALYIDVPCSQEIRGTVRRLFTFISNTRSRLNPVWQILRKVS